jgi:hypothetical protein
MKLTDLKEAQINDDRWVEITTIDLGKYLRRTFKGGLKTEEWDGIIQTRARSVDPCVISVCAYFLNRGAPEGTAPEDDMKLNLVLYIIPKKIDSFFKEKGIKNVMIGDMKKRVHPRATEYFWEITL